MPGGPSVVTEHEHNRWAKLKQLANNTPHPSQPNFLCDTGTRPAPSRNTPLSTSSPFPTMIRHGFTSTHTFHKPTLNWPFISQLGQSLPAFSSPPQTTSHCPTTHPVYITLHALTVLRDLTTTPPANYGRVESRYTDLEVYAIRRVATSLEEPWAAVAPFGILNALKYRNLTPPKST